MKQQITVPEHWGIADVEGKRGGQAVGQQGQFQVSTVLVTGMSPKFLIRRGWTGGDASGVWIICPLG